MDSAFWLWHPLAPSFLKSPCSSISVSLFKSSLTGIALDLSFLEDAQVEDEAKVTFFICAFLEIITFFFFFSSVDIGIVTSFSFLFFNFWYIMLEYYHPMLYFKFTGSLRKYRMNYMFIKVTYDIMLY